MRKFFIKYEFFILYIMFMLVIGAEVGYFAYTKDKSLSDIFIKDEFMVAFLLAFNTSVFWGLILHRVDRFEKEPFDEYFLKLIVPALFLSYFVAGFLDYQMMTLFGKESAYLAVGFIEEGVKMISVLLFVYKSKYFNEPMDGLFYGGIAAVTFSFVENIFYNIDIMKDTYDLKDEYIYLFGRFVSTFGHVTLAGVWGYELGKYKFGKSTKTRVGAAFLFGALFHSFYDLAILYEKEYISLVITIFLILFFMFAVFYFNRISPFNRSYLFECDSCHYHVRENSEICPRCGKVFVKALKSYQLYCSRCNNPVSKTDQVCKSCGFELKNSTF